MSPDRGQIGSEVVLTGELGANPLPIVLSGGPGDEIRATVRSWSPSRVEITVPVMSYGSRAVLVMPGCTLPSPPQFTVIPPPRIYINNNANNADGVNTITTLAYDSASGAITPVGPPTSVGIPASRRAGCSDSLLIAGNPPQLYVSGDTGVVALDLELDTGRPRPGSSRSTFLSGSTGGADLHRTIGAYAWNATDDGIVVWRDGGLDGLTARTKLSTTPARALTLDGGRPHHVYATRGDGTFDAWSATYVKAGDGPGLLPVLTPLEGSPFGTPAASPGGLAIGVVAGIPATPLLYVPSAAGLGVWRIDYSAETLREVAGSPFPLAPPSGGLGRPVFAGPLRARAIYLAVPGSGTIVGATLDADGIPSQAPGSPWSFAPALTNLSCMTAVSGPTPGSLRLIATDAGNRRIGVFDVPPGAAKPMPVPGSPFAMTETPSELASGLATLGVP